MPLLFKLRGKDGFGMHFNEIKMNIIIFIVMLNCFINLNLQLFCIFQLYVVVTEGKDGIFNGNANLYVSNDSGVTFTKSDMDFPFTTALIFHPHLNYTNYLMILSKEVFKIIIIIYKIL